MDSMRFLVFGGDQYYPKGGNRDLIYQDDDFGSAKGFARGYVAARSLMWARVYDTLKREEVFHCNSPEAA